MAEIGFGLGSNIGDRIGLLSQALARLFAGPEIRFVACSSIYRTPPWGPVPQPWFANLCTIGESDLAPLELLARCKAIEAELGRVPGERWGPRAIDIDLLYRDGETVALPGLTLPHPELLNRAFVLVPLAEVRPDLIVAGARIGDAAAAADQTGIAAIAPPWRPQPFGG
jgi:2-amino-4-hydroxy-6-hydroxymethyldihydropteridine diphosphokinase